MMTSDENATQPEQDPIEEDAGAADESMLDPQTARIAELEAENADLKDRAVRAAAEMENLRKRTEREVKDAKAYAISSFARDMLVATDNLSRAIMTVSDEAREGAEGTLKSLIEGIDMTEREMQRLLQRHGVMPISAAGEKFDPHRHQAMFEVPDESVPEGTVVQVMQEGYAISDRVLRPAMVGVSKGGPKRGPAPEAPGEAAEVEPGEPSEGEPGENYDRSA